MMTVLRILAPLLVFALGFIPIILQEKWWRLHDGRTKRHRHVVWLLVGVMALAAMINGCLAWSDYMHASKVDILLQDLRGQVDLKTTQIVALSEANAGLSQNIADSIIGGSSYCCVEFSNYRDDVILPMVKHRGKHPLYDVTVNLVDLDRAIESYKEHGLEKMDNGQTVRGNLAPGQVFMLAPISLRGRNLVRMRAIISARNGGLMQMIHGRKIGKMWQFAMELTRCPNNELVAEEIPEAFPKDPNGRYDWNSGDTILNSGPK